MARHPAPFVLGLALAAAAGCAADAGETADLEQATSRQLRRAVDAASGADAVAAAQLAAGLAAIGEASACPRVEQEGTTTVITGGCDGPAGPIAGRVILEAPVPGTARGGMARVTFEGFGDRERTIDGVVEAGIDGALAADVAVTADGIAVRTTLEVTCDGVGLCAAAAGASIEVGDLGRAEVAGAWRLRPAGGYLTLIGHQTVTFDLNATDAAGCLPYTIDGVPGGLLCD